MAFLTTYKLKACKLASSTSNSSKHCKLAVMRKFPNCQNIYIDIATPALLRGKPY